MLISSLNLTVDVSKGNNCLSINDTRSLHGFFLCCGKRLRKIFVTESSFCRRSWINLSFKTNEIDLKLNYGMNYDVWMVNAGMRMRDCFSRLWNLWSLSRLWKLKASVGFEIRKIRRIISLNRLWNFWLV